MPTPPTVQNRYAEPVPPPVVDRGIVAVTPPPIQQALADLTFQNLLRGNHPLIRKLSPFTIPLVVLLIGQVLVCCTVWFVIVSIQASRPVPPPHDLVTVAGRQQPPHAYIASQPMTKQVEPAEMPPLTPISDQSAAMERAPSNSPAESPTPVTEKASASEATKPTGEKVTPRKPRSFAEQIVDVERALKEEPNNAKYQNTLGYLLTLTNQDPSRARRLIQSALDQEPSNYDFNYAMGFHLMNLLRAKEALPYLEKAVENSHGEVIIWMHAGDVLWGTGQDDKAKMYWQTATALNRASQDTEKVKKFYSGLLEERSEIVRDMARKQRESEELAVESFGEDNGLNIVAGWVDEAEESMSESYGAYGGLTTDDEWEPSYDEPESDDYTAPADYSDSNQQTNTRERCYTCRGVTSCQRCSGNGEQTCSYCNGSGQEYSGYSSEDDYKSCSGCSGSGRGRCYACNGSGRCRACSGTGIAGL